MSSRLSLSRMDWWHGRWMLFVLALCAFPAALQIVALYADSKPPTIASYIWRLATFLYGCALPFEIGALGWMRRAEFLSTVPNLTRKLRQTFACLLLTTLLLATTQVLEKDSAWPLLDFGAYLGLCCLCCWRFKNLPWSNLNFRDPWVWLSTAAGLTPLLIIFSSTRPSLQSTTPGLQGIAMLAACLAIAWRWHSLQDNSALSGQVLRWKHWLLSHEMLSTTLPVAIFAVLCAQTNSNFFLVPLTAALALYRLRRESLLTPLRLRWLAGAGRTALFYIALRQAGSKMLCDLGVLAAAFAVAASIEQTLWADIPGYLLLPGLVYLVALRLQFTRLCRDERDTSQADLWRVLWHTSGALFGAIICAAFVASILSNKVSGKLEMDDALAWVLLTLLMLCLLDLFTRQRRQWMRLPL
jgi:hypothetical protein